jgi:hypothetical protein
VLPFHLLPSFFYLEDPYPTHSFNFCEALSVVHIQT